MAAPRRRECCLPNGQSLRLPAVKSVPTHATIFKAKMHDEIVSMFRNGSTTIRFDDKSLTSGLFHLQGDSYAFEALRNVGQPGNPMDLLLSIDPNNHIQLNGKITNTINVGRVKVDPNARRRKTSPPSVQKKRNAASLDPDKSANRAANNAAAAAPKRQRVGTAAIGGLRSTKPTGRPVSSLNGFGMGGSSPSPHVSPGQAPLNGFRSKSRSITPPNQGATSMKRSIPPNARASPAQSASSPGSSSGTTTMQRGLSAEREKKLRYGIIHLLALDDTPVQGLRSRLLNPHDSPIGDRPFLNIVRKVSKHSKAGYVLKEEFWDEVEENCDLYSEPDRKRVRDILARRERRKSVGVARGGRNGVGVANQPPMIVDDRSSNYKITEALVRFDNRARKNGAIRNAKEEDEARSVFKAYHSVYMQVNKRMEEIRVKMTDYHTRYNQASVKEQNRIAEKIEKYFNETVSRHEEYRMYLPKLHDELKCILKRLDTYVNANL